MHDLFSCRFVFELSIGMSCGVPCLASVDDSDDWHETSYIDNVTAVREQRVWMSLDRR